MPRGPGVSFKRDLAALSVSIYAGPWRDLSINFPTLGALGLQGCEQIDLVIPIAACQFNPNDGECRCSATPGPASISMTTRESFLPPGRP